MNGFVLMTLFCFTSQCASGDWRIAFYCEHLKVCSSRPCPSGHGVVRSSCVFCKIWKFMLLFFFWYFSKLILAAHFLRHMPSTKWSFSFFAIFFLLKIWGSSFYGEPPPPIDLCVRPTKGTSAASLLSCDTTWHSLCADVSTKACYVNGAWHWNVVTGYWL